MSSTLSKKIETVANVGIIALTLSVGGILVKRQFFSTPSTASASGAASISNPAAGTRLSLGVDWTKSDHTVLLALSKDCHFCTESAPFYRKLVDETAGRSDVRIVAIFPREGVSDGNAYLNELGLSVAETRHAPLETIGARGTPTLVLVDKGGKVVQSWTGRLTSEKELELLSRLKCESCN